MLDVLIFVNWDITMFSQVKYKEPTQLQMDVLSQTTHLLMTDFMNEKSAMFSLRDILISCSKLVEV